MSRTLHGKASQLAVVVVVVAHGAIVIVVVVVAAFSETVKFGQSPKCVCVCCVCLTGSCPARIDQVLLLCIVYI